MSRTLSSLSCWARTDRGPWSPAVLECDASESATGSTRSTSAVGREASTPNMLPSPDPSVARIPRRLDLLHAGASPAVALTAVQGIDDALEVKRNERVVIVGASGNVGMFAVQFAKHRGARVLAIASGRDGTAFARRLGADVAIDGKRSDIAEALTDFAPDGVDAVLGLVGGKVLTTGIDALRRGGRVAYPNGIDPAPRKRRGIKFISYDAKMGLKEFARLNRAIEKMPLTVPIAKQFRLDLRRRRRTAGSRRDICWEESFSVLRIAR